MNLLDDIKENIKKGLSNGYKQNVLLLSSDSNFLNEVREYLLTVNVAQQFLSWNEQNRYKIHLEYPVLHFYNNAFVDKRWETTDLLNFGIIERQSEHSPTNKLHQKIDIVITQEQNSSNYPANGRVLSGIELKGINVRDSEILDDAKRMCKAMMRADAISTNSIEFCFCGFLIRFDKDEDIVTDAFINTKITEVQNRWDKICFILATDYPSLDFTVEKFDIVNIPLELVIRNQQQLENDPSEIANETGIIVGYILTIKKI